MKYDSELTNVEKRAYLLFHKDGFIDIAVGLCIFFSWVAASLNHSYLWIILIILDVLAWHVAKKTITIPRIGQATYSKERKHRNSVLLSFAFFSLISLIATSITLYFLYEGPNASTALNVLLLNEVQLVIGIFTILLLFISALFLGLIRFFIYATLSLAALLVNQLTDVVLWSTYLYLGIIVMVTGIILSFRFLRMYKLIDTSSIEAEIGDQYGE